MAVMQYDANGHELPNPQAVQLTAPMSGTTPAIGQIVPTTNAGATPTVAIVNATDRAGRFQILPAGAGQAPGGQAVVTFAVPYQKVPSAILVQMDNNAGGGMSTMTATSTAITTAGFTVAVGASLTAGQTYNVQYLVVAAA